MDLIEKSEERGDVARSEIVEKTEDWAMLHDLTMRTRRESSVPASKHMPVLEKLICIPQRWVLAIMGFFAFFNVYTLRVCLSIAITKMAKPLNLSERAIDDTCPPYGDHSGSNASSTGEFEGSFEWSEYTQGIILSSFYWGYVLTHIPGGLLSEKFSPKYILGFGILLTAIFTVLTPAATFWGGANALIALRFLMGLGEGVIHPSVNCLLSQWIPPNERTFTTSFVFSGMQFGIIVSGAISGTIMRHAGDDWPSVFYLFGGVGVLWFVLYALLCYDSPRQHPFIKPEERRYLHEKMREHVHEEPPPFPWRRALGSRAFLAVIVAQLGQDWNGYTVMSDLPKYLLNVLRLPVDLNGYVASVYSLTTLIFCLVVSWLSDWLIARGHVSRTNVRKINTAVSTVGTPGFMLMAMYVGCDVGSAVALIVVGLTIYGSATSGVKINALDLSPNYSGTLIGISNGAGALMGIFAPYVVGVLAPNQTAREWRLIFYISTAMSIVATTFYLIFADGEVQEWNDARTEEEKRRDADDVEAIDLLLNAKLKLREDLDKKL